MLLEGVQRQLHVVGVVLDEQDFDRIVRHQCGLARSESEVERRALVGLGVGPDAAAVAVDDPLHDGEADAGALIVLGPVQPLEDAEQLVGVAHVEADAVVLDEIGRIALAVAVALPISIIALRLAARVLEGVGQQVDPDLLEQRRVGLARRQLADVDLDLPAVPLAT